PLTLTSWKLAPALAAGCTAVIKPSEFTSASMLELARLFTEAGFPNGVVNVADLEQAVKGVVSGIFAATGQSCQAGSRLLVQRSIHDAFVAKLIDFMKDVKLGDPTEAS